MCQVEIPDDVAAVLGPVTVQNIRGVLNGALDDACRVGCIEELVEADCRARAARQALRLVAREGNGMVQIAAVKALPRISGTTEDLDVLDVVRETHAGTPVGEAAEDAYREIADRLRGNPTAERLALTFM